MTVRPVCICKVEGPIFYTWRCPEHGKIMRGTGGLIEIKENMPARETDISWHETMWRAIRELPDDADLHRSADKS